MAYVGLGLALVTKGQFAEAAAAYHRALAVQPEAFWPYANLGSLHAGDAFGSALAASFWGAVIAFGADALVTVIVTLFTKPKPAEELEGLVYGTKVDMGEVAHTREPWWRNPLILGGGALALAAALYIPFL